MGRANKWADKWAKDGTNVWHEKWGEEYDGEGGCVKFTDKVGQSVPKWLKHWHCKSVGFTVLTRYHRQCGNTNKLP